MIGKNNTLKERIELSFRIPDSKVVRKIMSTQSSIASLEAPNRVKEKFGYALNNKPGIDYNPEEHLDVEDIEIKQYEKGKYFHDDKINLELVYPLSGVALKIPIVRDRKTGKFHGPENGEIEERVIFPGYSFSKILGSQHLGNLSTEEQKELGIYYPKDEIFNLAIKKHNERKNMQIEKMKQDGTWEKYVNENPLAEYFLSSEGFITYPHFNYDQQQAKEELGVTAKEELDKISPEMVSIDNSRIYVELLKEMFASRNNSRFKKITSRYNSIRNVIRSA